MSEAGVDPIASRYEVERELGRGGMGVVLLARDTVIGRPVALKRLTPPTGWAEQSEISERFAREARLTGRLTHPRIVTLFDVIADEGGIYLVLEYYPSRSLAEKVQSDGVLDEVAVRKIGGGVCDALDHAHGAAVVHRDVKPDNILLGEMGPKVADFGIARSLSDSMPAAAPLTATGNLVGTPAFMSPEQARGEGAGPPADIFALGATLWFALTGQSPFMADDPASTLYRVVHDDLDVGRLAVSPGLRSAISAATSKSQEERPTAAELRVMLVGRSTEGTPPPS